MKRAMLITLAVLVTAVWSGEAAAGWFGGKKDADERQPLIHRFSGTAQRFLLVGELRQEAGGRWRLDDAELALLPGCLVVEEDGRTGTLRSAGQVLVLGARYGDLVVARQIRICPDRPAEATAQRDRYGIQWSEANPDVGQGTVEGIE